MDLLKRLKVNQAKVGILILIVGAGFLGLDAIGIRDLSDSRMALTLLPLALLYVAKKNKLSAIFAG
jgi:hypothetical protein